jgi:hypothetical protein
MNAGTTFMLAQDYKVIDNHLWVVISDTENFPDQVVLVSVTTYTEAKDPACLIERNDHPLITHRSCVSYPHAKVTSLAKLLECKDRGAIVLQTPVSTDLLERIRHGSGDSTTLRSEIADILLEQDIIRLDE